MAKILDVDGKELTGSDRGLLFMLVVCGELTYLEKQYVKELLMPQYVELMCAEGHPLHDRMIDLKEMVEYGAEQRRRQAKRNLNKRRPVRVKKDAS